MIRSIHHVSLPAYAGTFSIGVPPRAQFLGVFDQGGLPVLAVMGDFTQPLEQVGVFGVAPYSGVPDGPLRHLGSWQPPGNSVGAVHYFTPGVDLHR